MIVEYMNICNSGGYPDTPFWMRDGSYFYDATNHTMVGWVPDLADREYYVPDSLTVLTRGTLKTRVTELVARQTVYDKAGQPITDASAAVDEWCDEHGEP